MALLERNKNFDIEEIVPYPILKDGKITFNYIMSTKRKAMEEHDRLKKLGY